MNKSKISATKTETKEDKTPFYTWTKRFGWRINGYIKYETKVT